MAVIAGMTNSFKQEILAGVHNLKTVADGGDAIKIALYRPSADITQATTAYTATGEVTSDNYTAAGSSIASAGIVLSGSTVYLDFPDTSWTPVTFTDDGGTDNRVRGALIYNAESGKGNKSIAVLDFGLARQVSAGTFTVKFPTPAADDAIIRIK